MLAETGLATQSRARLWNVSEELAGEEQFCLTYGDGVADIGGAEVIKFQRRHCKAATVTGVHRPGRFGVMIVDSTQITSFSEKPQAGEVLLNSGYFVIPANVIDLVEDDPGPILEQQPLQRLARAGERIMFEHHGFGQPMGTYRERNLLGDFWDSGVTRGGAELC